MTSFLKKFSLLAIGIVLGLSLSAGLVSAQNTNGQASGVNCNGNGFSNTSGICLPSNPFPGNNGLAAGGDTGAQGLITTVIKYLLRFAGVIAVIMVIYGGYVFMTSGGSEEAATKGKQILTYSIIGLAVIILAYAIVSAVTNFLIKGSL